MKIYFSIFLHFPLTHLLGARQPFSQWTEVDKISNSEECNIFITKLLQVPYICDEQTLIMSDIIILIINNGIQKSLSFCHAFCPHLYLGRLEFYRRFRNIKASLACLIIILNISVTNIQGKSYYVVSTKMCL